MIRTISIALASAALAVGLSVIAACATAPEPPTASLCEAMRPDMPVKYHATTTDAETIANIRRANARFTAACPEGRR